MTDNKSDPVNHPSHYADSCSIECIDSMMAVLGREGLVSFCIGNAYKYIWRHKHKGKPKEDLAKAKWYIDKAYCLDNGRHTDQIIGLRELYTAYKHDLESIENDKEESKEVESIIKLTPSLASQAPDIRPAPMLGLDMEG